MKWISDYRGYLQLSAAIFLDGITPVLQGCIITLLISWLGTTQSFSRYALIAGLYYPCAALATSTCIATKFYIAKHHSDQVLCGRFLGSSIVLSLILSGLSSMLFMIFSHCLISDHNGQLSVVYALFIALTTFCSTLTTVNEGMQRVAINTVSNSLRIPLFLITLLLIRAIWLQVDIIMAIAWALVASQMMILSYLIHQRAHWPRQRMIQLRAMKQLLAFGLPHGLLFSAKKFVRLLLLISLKPLPIMVAAWQLTLQLSLYWSLLGSALASALLVRYVSEKDPHYQQRLIHFLLLSLLAIAVFTVPLIKLAGCQVIHWMIVDPQVTVAITSHLALLILFMLSEMLMSCLVGFCCARGDTWRPQALWMVLLLLLYVCGRQQASYRLWLLGLTGLNLLVSGLFWWGAARATVTTGPLRKAGRTA